MTEKDIVKNADFEKVSEVRTDSKNRIALGRHVSMKARIYKVYRNSLGQIILDPQVAIPAYEAWLFKNREAASMVKGGLRDAKNHKLVKAKEDYSKYVDNSK